MRPLQKAQLELLRVFLDICQRRELPCFLVCGSALGAAKYGGFIPWDDDIDVAMPRWAYEQFVKEAPALLEQPYFLQNYQSDPAFPGLYSKLRNSNTTCIEKSAAHLPIHHGVFIDIFPLDGYPKGKGRQLLFELRKKLYTHQVSCTFRVPRSLPAAILCKVLRALGFQHRTAKTLDRYTRMISQYEIDQSDWICNHGNWQGRREYAPKQQYAEGIMASFAGLPVRIPADYDAYLTQKYGNWRQELPENQRVGHHEYIVLDLEKSYTHYIHSSADEP